MVIREMKKGNGCSAMVMLALLLALFLLPSLASADVISRWRQTSGVGVVDVSESFAGAGLALSEATRGEGFHIISQHVFLDENATMLSSSDWIHLQSKAGNFSHGSTGKNYNIGAVACESHTDVEYLDKDTSYAMTNTSLSMYTNAYVTGKSHIGFMATTGGGLGGGGGVSAHGTEDYFGDFHIHNQITMGGDGDWLVIP
jgi:hypothetical protein